MTAQVIAALAAFILMEPATAAVHRWVMHGAGWVLHRSHHRPGRGRLQANDAFPVMFAGLTVGLMALGSGVRSLHLLLAVGAGVTAYGLAYAFVHDAVIHRRFGRAFPSGRGPLRRLRQAHAQHHRFGGAPYGMLWPVTPLRVGYGAKARADGDVAAAQVQ